MDKHVTIRERFRPKGHVRVEVLHDDGRVDVIEQDNIVTSGGLSLLAQSWASKNPVLPGWIGFGTDSTPAALSDTALGAEVVRKAIGFYDESAGVSTFKAFLPKSEGNGNMLAEVGLLNASSSGTLAARAILASPIEKEETISVTVTWTFTFADNS